MDNLAKYRLQNAKEKIESAKILLDAGKYKDSISRSYYAIFTAIRAVLALDQVDFSKHSGVITYFQKNYIKTEIFDKKYSKYLQSAFQQRNDCDYDDFYFAAKEDAEELLRQANEFYQEICTYINYNN